VALLDGAIEMEERARSFYEEAAGRVRDPSSKRILALLAKEESRHAAALKELKGGVYGRLERSLLSEDVRGIIEGGVKEGKEAVSEDASMRGILQEAMEIESATRTFYVEKRKETADPKERELFSLLAEQELRHYLLVSGLAEYFDRPAEWIEAAEFGLRPEY